VRFWRPRPVVGEPLVGVAVAAHLADDRQAAALACLWSSFRAQTYPRWLMRVTHDGPAAEGLRGVLGRLAAEDGRCRVVETPERLGRFGHPHRQAAAGWLLDAGCDWVLHTNQDNYYVPVFLEWLLSAAQAQGAWFVYCDFVRSHRLWACQATRPRRGEIDLGAFLAHRRLAEAVAFDSDGFAADGDYAERLVAAAGGRVARVAATLFVHN